MAVADWKVCCPRSVLFEEGYIAYNRGKINQPDIVSIDIPEKNGELDIKWC